MKQISYLDISLIVPVWNVSSIIEKVLLSIKRQTYPVREVIIIDNHSLDDSVKIIKRFMKKNKKMNITLIEREKTYGVSSSYNLGSTLAKGEYIISLHSDSVLPTTKEIEKLVKPFTSDSKIVATYPYVVHPKKIWLTYNFWQKCQFAPVAGTKRHSMNGKFDCYKKSVFKKIGGYNEKKFNSKIGSEDADMHFRLVKYGKIFPTQAKVVHLHNLNKNYSFNNLLFNRQFLSVAYGTQIRYHWKEMKLSVVYFFIKPILGFSIFAAFLNPLFLAPLVFFPFIYMRNMFFDAKSLRDIKILALPGAIIFLIYYETYWLFHGLLGSNKRA